MIRDAGDLRHRVILQEIVETQNGYGETIKTWRNIGQVFAKLEPTAGMERFRASQMQADVTHAITIRYKTGVVPQMQIAKGDRTFPILAVVNLEERNHWMELHCKENV